MILPWMIYSAWIALLLAGAAWVLESAAQSRQIPSRWIWVAALVGSAALPLIASFSEPPPAPQASPLPDAPTILASRPASGSLEDIAAWAAMNGVEVSYAATLAPVGTTPSAATAASWAERARAAIGLIAWRPTLPTLSRGYDIAGLLAWVATSFLFLGIFLRASLRLRRMRTSWSEVKVEDRSVLISNDTGPAVVGFFRSAIVMPSWALALPREDRELILRHEEEHRRAHDLALVIGASVLLVLLPWNLALWWQVSRLRLAVEVDCDRRVVRERKDLRRYAMLLIEIGRRGVPSRIPALALSQSTSFLERRIRTMTRRTKPRLLTTASLVLAAGLIGATAYRVEAPVGLLKSAISSTGMNAVGVTPTTTSEADARAVANASATSTAAPSTVASEPQGRVIAGELRGTVSDVNTNALLTEAHVYLVGTQLSSISSASGGFAMGNVPAGTYELRAERIGYVRVSKQVTVTDGAVQTVDLQMVTGSTLETATTGQVKGRVTAFDGTVLENGSITVRTLIPEPLPSSFSVFETSGAVSASNGSFVRTNIPPGTYEATAKADGVSPVTQKLTMVAGGVVEVNFQLGTANASTATVAGLDPQREAIMRAIASQPIEYMGPNATATPAIIIDGVVALRSAPGVSPIENMNPNEIERVEIISGPAAVALYGPNAVGGVIQVIRKKPAESASAVAAPSLRREVGSGAAARSPSSPEVQYAIEAQRTAATPLRREVAPTGRIQGRATNTADGSPLTDVQVYAAGPQIASNIGSMTRPNGNYVILNVPVGTYELRAERIGLGTIRQPVTVSEGGIVEVNFSLADQAVDPLDPRLLPGSPSAARLTPSPTATGTSEQMLATAVRPGQIRGQIQNEITGEPLSDVQAYITDPSNNALSMGSLSRATGVFIILDIEPGTYDLHLEKRGFTPVVMRVTANGYGVEVNAALKPQP